MLKLVEGRESDILNALRIMTLAIEIATVFVIIGGIFYLGVTCGARRAMLYAAIMIVPFFLCTSLALFALT